MKRGAGEIARVGSKRDGSSRFGKLKDLIFSPLIRQQRWSTRRMVRDVENTGCGQQLMGLDLFCPKKMEGREKPFSLLIGEELL